MIDRLVVDTAMGTKDDEYDYLFKGIGEVSKSFLPTGVVFRQVEGLISEMLL